MKSTYVLGPATLEQLSLIAEARQKETSRVEADDDLAEHSRVVRSIMDFTLGFDSLRKSHMGGPCEADLTPADSKKLVVDLCKRRKDETTFEQMDNWIESVDGPPSQDLYWNTNVVNVEQTKCRPAHAKTSSGEQFRMAGGDVERMALREHKWNDIRKDFRKSRRAQEARVYFKNQKIAEQARRSRLVRDATRSQTPEGRVHAILSAGGDAKSTLALPAMLLEREPFEPMLVALPLETIYPNSYPAERYRQRWMSAPPFIPDNFVSQEALLGKLPAPPDSMRLGMDGDLDFAVYEEGTAKDMKPDAADETSNSDRDSLHDTPAQTKVEPAATAAVACGQGDLDAMDTGA